MQNLKIRQGKDTTTIFFMDLLPTPQGYHHTQPPGDFSVTDDNVNHAEAIYVPDVPILMGETFRKQPKHKSNITYVPLPTTILDHLVWWTYTWFLIFQRKPIFNTESKLLNFLSVKTCKGQRNKEVSQVLYVLQEVNSFRGFEISSYNGGSATAPDPVLIGLMPTNTA